MEKFNPFEKTEKNESGSMNKIKALVFAMLGLLSVEAQGQTLQKKYSVEEINKAQVEAKNIIVNLKAEKDSVLLPEKTIVYEVLSSSRAGNIISVTEKNKDGSEIQFSDGYDMNLPTVNQYASANGFPTVSFYKGGDQVKSLFRGQGGLEKHAQHLSNADFSEFVLIQEHPNGEVGRVTLNGDEAVTFVGSYVDHFKNDLNKIQTHQKTKK